MKKIISLVLVLVLIFALSPMAYAAPSTYEYELIMYDGSRIGFKNLHSLIKYLFFYDAADGVFQSNGHLSSCTGGDCNCLLIMAEAEKEQRKLDWERSLAVYYRTWRDEDDQRHDTVVAELQRPYKASKVTEAEEYLEGKEAVAKKLQEFANDDLAEMIYLSNDFIHNQTIGSLEYAEDNFGSKLHVEYTLTSNGLDPLSGHGIGLVEDGSEKGAAEHFAFSREPISDKELPEHDLIFRAGNLVIVLPESCIDKAFSIGLSYYENGAVRVMLCDDAGKLIPGAVISTVLADGAKGAALVNGSGKLEAIKDAAVEGGCIAFEAPTGDDVFALSK